MSIIFLSTFVVLAGMDPARLSLEGVGVFMMICDPVIAQNMSIYDVYPK